jgi:hypothetical protein
LTRVYVSATAVAYDEASAAASGNED